MATMTPIPEGEYEHVCLSSDEMEQVELQTVNAALEQEFDGGRLQLAIFNNSYLRILRADSHATPADYWVNLAFVDPVPVRQADKLSSVVTLVAVAATCVLWAIPRLPMDISVAWWWPPAMILALAATLISVALAASRYLGTYALLTAHGRAPVLRLASARPDRRRVRNFFDALKGAAQRARTDGPADRGHRLRDEMKEHRRLHGEGVLGDDQFQAARALILRAHG